jgi:hypothetical protein
MIKLIKTKIMFMKYNKISITYSFNNFKIIYILIKIIIITNKINKLLKSEMINNLLNIKWMILLRISINYHN